MSWKGAMVLMTLVKGRLYAAPHSFPALSPSRNLPSHLTKFIIYNKRANYMFTTKTMTTKKPWHYFLWCGTRFLILNEGVWGLRRLMDI